MKKPFIAVINLPTLLTLAGVVSALGAVWRGWRGDMAWSMVLLVAAGLCDLFDGLVARKLALPGEQRAFGAQIDSLADVVSFGVAPAALLWFFAPGTAIDFALGALYVICAAQRLAYFNVSGLCAQGHKSFYTGLPVTYAALVFPLVFILSRLVEPSVFAGILRGSFLVVAALFITRVPIPKPRGLAYLAFPALAVGVSAYWLLV